MSDRLRNILVTGGSSEIGTAILNVLSKMDMVKIIATSNTNKINNSNFKYRCLQNIDLNNDTCLLSLRDEVSTFFQGSFSIIHSVGNFWKHKPLNYTDIGFAKEMMLSHYATLFGVSHYLLPLAAERGGGRIVAFSCNSVLYNYPEMAAFTSAKAAVECLIKCIANEWSKDKIVANAIALPSIGTNAVKEDKKYGDHNNYITPDEVAEIVIDILAEMSPYMNGNVIKIFKYSKSFYHKSFFERNPSSIKE
ncbi:SDR family oxidoreductase [Candidatus Magnetominusculus xianensis]|uniref:SDR family oxidoreductase n=1 Tax=Candidatus Magnetominusculus xianensis TaxID=1748249 RepID=A0ABR5SJD7_9BACT|nr:SDR family oxidoreductase [Candidatus Magnetominusculus xianensis]KWT85940.1 SDR family oxidoreductase [Candidatus Magnetominusculus xianensis]MBF0403613.1 SDR family oxidoreductase [Nitrospirota bacterium]